MTRIEQPPQTWRKSSYTNTNGPECVEIACLPEAMAIRDSKHPSGGHLTLRPAAWEALLTTVRSELP